MKVLQYQNRVLKEVSKCFDVNEIPQDGLREKLLYEFNKLHNSQGLSMIQLGVPKNLAIVKINKKIYTMYNIRVLKTFGKFNSLEGCESVKGRYVVKRPIVAKVSWYDENAKLFTKWLFFKQTRAFCHEFDHMLGICIPDIGKYWIGNKYLKEK